MGNNQVTISGHTNTNAGRNIQKQKTVPQNVQPNSLFETKSDSKDKLFNVLGVTGFLTSTIALLAEHTMHESAVIEASKLKNYSPFKPIKSGTKLGKALAAGGFLLLMGTIVAQTIHEKKQRA